jgi:hypothetical protein
MWRARRPPQYRASPPRRRLDRQEVALAFDTQKPGVVAEMIDEAHFLARASIVSARTKQSASSR